MLAEHVERPQEGGEGDVALVGIKPALDEHRRGLLDLRGEGVEEAATAEPLAGPDDAELGAAVGGRLEGGAELRERALPPVESRAEVQAAAPILGGQGQGGGVDPRIGGPIEVAAQAIGALVAVVGILGEELVDDRREHRRHAQALQRLWSKGQVSVDELSRVAVDEGGLAGEELVEGHAEGVEVAAVVDAAGDPAGLLGRDVGQGPGQHRRAEARLLKGHRQR